MTVPFQFAILLFLVISQCSVLPAEVAKAAEYTAGDTAEEIPVQVDPVAQLSDDEREWYDKFQEGLLFFSGWKEISKEILAALPQEVQPEIKELLTELGVRIGTEWSKDNTVRRIDTDQLRSWGDRLHEARDRGGEQLVRAVQRISSEVDELLCESCPPPETDNL